MRMNPNLSSFDKTKYTFFYKHGVNLSKCILSLKYAYANGFNYLHIMPDPITRTVRELNYSKLLEQVKFEESLYSNFRKFSKNCAEVEKVRLIWVSSNNTNEVREIRLKKIRQIRSKKSSR